MVLTITPAPANELYLLLVGDKATDGGRWRWSGRHYSGAAALRPVRLKGKDWGEWSVI